LISIFRNRLASLRSQNGEGPEIFVVGGKLCVPDADEARHLVCSCRHWCAIFIHPSLHTPCETASREACLILSGLIIYFFCCKQPFRRPLAVVPAVRLSARLVTTSRDSPRSTVPALTRAGWLPGPAVRLSLSIDHDLWVLHGVVCAPHGPSSPTRSPTPQSSF
jgi:hypothetical protein